MKKKTILLVLLFLLTLSVTFSFADSYFREIEVYFDNIQIVIENKLLDLEEQPFIYQGRVYVPLRFVSNKLGYTVGWDGKTKTVTIDRPDSPAIIEPCNPKNGESFVYGQILSINYKEKKIKIEQHMDDNSVKVFGELVADNNIAVILQRNSHHFQISFSDLKVGDIVGIILTKDKKIRGIIVDT